MLKHSLVLGVILILIVNISLAHFVHQNYLIHWQRLTMHDLHDKTSLEAICHQPKIESKH